MLARVGSCHGGPEFSQINKSEPFHSMASPEKSRKRLKKIITDLKALKHKCERLGLLPGEKIGILDEILDDIDDDVDDADAKERRELRKELFDILKDMFEEIPKTSMSVKSPAPGK